MTLSINTTTIVEGTPTGKNWPIPPTEEEITVAWKALQSVTEKLGGITNMIEVLGASFHQSQSNKIDKEVDLFVRFNAVLVVPLAYPVKKMESKYSVEIDFLRKKMDEEMNGFMQTIACEVERALSIARDSVKAMGAMLETMK